MSANIAFYVIFSCRPSSGPKVMDVQAIHATVRDVLDVVQDSTQHLNTVDFEEVDRISLAFNRSSFSLGQILNAVLVCGESNVCFHGGIISSLRELHMCVTQLFIEWETRLLHLRLGSSPSRSSLGRPNISINIPMVCQC